MTESSDHILQEIKQRVPLSGIISRKVTLQSKGRGEYAGLCPFHQEKSPSFTVSDTKGFYHCFGCMAHGDIFTFLVEKEGLSFPEAVEQLAKEAGVVLSPHIKQRQQQEQEQEAKYAPLYKATEEACVYFQEQLRTSLGKPAQQYLQKRGFDKTVIDTFRLGFSPDQWHGLHHYLKQRGYTDQQLLAAGLLSKNEKGEVYDRFRGRLMFPIANLSGRIVAFGGRILDKGEPKYLNSPETDIFKKGRLLYHYDRAKPEAMKVSEVIVTEGYIDTIALYHAGIKHVVASLGTALTKEQVQLLWRVSKKPILCFDGDTAGFKAMERAAHVIVPMLKPGYTVMFAKMPSKYDPDDVIKRLGVDYMKDLLAKAGSLSDELWYSEYRKQDASIPEHKAELNQRLRQLVEQIEDKDVAAYYKEFFNRKLWEMGSHKKEYKEQKVSHKDTLGQVSLPQNANMNTVDGCEWILTLLIVVSPELLASEAIYEEWLAIEYQSNELDNLRHIILEIMDYEAPPTGEKLMETLSHNGHAEEVKYFKSLKNSVLLPIWSDNNDAYEAWRYVFNRRHLAVLKEEYKEMVYQMTEEAMCRASSLKQQMEQLEKTITKAEMAFGDR